MKTAGLPTFLRSSRLRDKPALIKIMINAISLKSAEIIKIDSSKRFKTYGPNMIPVNSMPIIRGSFKRCQSAAKANPAKKIKDNDVNIIFLL